MAKGGKRPGAGRKPGVSNKPTLASHWSKKQIKDFFQSMYERQKTSDRIAVWCGDQLAGKAQQAIDLTSGGKPLLISGDE